MNFVLFLLVNVFLFLRPAELVPELQLPLYQVAILACLACSVTAIFRLFMESPLRDHPTVTMILGMTVLSLASLVANFGPAKGLTEFFDLAKVIVYFLLFLALVTTPQRLRILIAVITLCVMVTATIGILHFKEVISLPVLEIKGEEVFDPVKWEYVRIRRLRFTGMMQDPNEVAVFLSVLTFLCAYQQQSRSYGIARHLWLIPMGTFLGAIAFTMSRGGLLSLLVGVVVFAIYRFQGVRMVQVAPGVTVEVHKPGAGKAIRFLVVMLPVILLAFGGRQSNFDSQTGSGSGRIELWSDWLQEFRANPILGVGPLISPATEEGQASSTPGMTGNTAIDHLAHNSYIQAFADLGFVGGAFFLGAFLWALGTLHRYSFGKTRILNVEQKRLLPYMVAAVVCYMVGMLTLSINYLITTVFVVSLPLVFYAMTPCTPLVSPPRLDGRGISRLVLISIGYLAFMYLFVRFFRNF